MFSNGYIQEEVYFDQPLSIINTYFPNHVFIRKKDLYDLKQTPRASYDRLSKFMLETISKREG